MFFRTLKKKIRECFVQGSHAKRRKLLTAIAEVVYDEYTEDNFYSRFTWLVEELLISDPSFNELGDKVDIECLKRGLAQAVDEAKKRLGNN